MPPNVQTAALIALLRDGETTAGAAAAIERSGSALAALADTRALLAPQRLADAIGLIESWEHRGIRTVSAFEDDYPGALREVAGRPALVFLTGALTQRDEHSVAIAGSRRATERGLETAAVLAEALVERGFTIVSGLAAGIDSAAHIGALRAGGRTVAVLGTGLDHCYPPQNSSLQREIGRRCAVLSQFWPESGPIPANFRARNAVTAALSLASVIVEASQVSGARILARFSLGYDRPVILLGSLLAQEWARELASRPGVYVVDRPEEVAALVEEGGAVPSSAIVE